MAASVTAALPCRGIIGIDIGVDVDRFSGRFRATPLMLRTLPLEVDGEGLDLGVVKDPDLGVEYRSRSQISALGGESSDSSSESDMASASFAARPGDMVSRKDVGAAAIVSTGCATMISSEYPEGADLAIGFHQDLIVHVDVDVVIFPRRK